MKIIKEKILERNKFLNSVIYAKNINSTHLILIERLSFRTYEKLNYILSS